MFSIRTKITLLTLCAIMITLGIVSAIGVVSIRNLGRSDADQMLRLTAETGAMRLEAYFESVEHSVETAAELVQDSLEGMPPEALEEQVEHARGLFERIAYHTNGVLTFYFRIDPEVSETVKGFWYVNQEGSGFQEHEVTDLTLHDTDDTSSLVWFTVPKATGEGVWLPPYNTDNLNVRVVSYNVPVWWEGRFLGVIGIELDYGMLVREVESIRIFETGCAFVLDQESNVIYHPQIDSGKLEPETAAVPDQDPDDGSCRVRYNDEGVWKEAAWEELGNGMRLYVTAPLSEIDRGWKDMMRYMLLAALAALAISGAVMLRFSGRITKPLRELTQAAKQAQSGNLEFALEYDKNDEVGILAQTLKQLAAHTNDDLSNARRMATIDSLTGIRNKHAYTTWEGKINAEIEKGDRAPFAVVVCDVDNLKKVNDLLGHKEGDACIRSACGKICSVFSHSPVFRTGGDEFVVLLSGEDFYQRKKLLEQINTVPRDLSKIRIGETVSAGMAEYDPDRHGSLLQVFEEADKDMYGRKQKRKDLLAPEEHPADSDPASAYIPVIHSRKKVLIVDDVEMNREIMGDLLLEDYDTLYAADGIEALEVLRSHKGEIDLVLLDLQMPNKTGREVIAEMQVDEELRSIPVVFMTVDQAAELDCLKSGAMDFIPKPYPDAEIVKARIAKCIELSEDRELIRYTERDRLTGLLNKEYFYRYVSRLDHLYGDCVLDALACDVNRFHAANKQYGRQFGDRVLRSIGNHVRTLARKTGGIGCRQGGDTFLLYCPHRDDYEQLLGDFLAGVFADREIEEKISLRFGVFADARQEADVEERFVRARIAADRVKDDDRAVCGFYDLG